MSDDDEELIELNDINRPYWEAMSEGRLSFQECADCGE